MSLDLAICCGQSLAMPTLDAAQRVRARIKDWVAKQGHGSRVALANAVNGMYGATRTSSWVTGVVNGSQDIRLADLDAIAECLDVPPGDLVRKPDRNYLELTMAETRVLMHFRALPWKAREHWLGWLEFVSNGVQNKSVPAYGSGVISNASGGTKGGTLHVVRVENREEATPENIERLLAEATERSVWLQDLADEFARAATARRRSPLETPKRRPPGRKSSDPSAADR